MLFRSLINRLLARGKVESVAILDLDGNVLVRSENLDLSQRDVRTILSALKAGERTSASIGLMKIPLRDTTFTCMFQAASNGLPGPLVGRADDLMFAAVKTSKCVVIGFSDLESPGSCIYEISEMGRVLELRSR